MRHFLAPILFVLFALGSILPAVGQSSQITVTPGDSSRKVDRSAVHVVQKLGGLVPLDATFRDRTGKSVTFGSQLGMRPAIVLPIFYNCTGICNLELRGTLETLAQMKTRRLGRDFDVIVVGIHPKETPDLAEGKFRASVAQLDQPGTEGGWRFLVGDYENIHKVTDALGFYYTYDEAKDAIDHPSAIMFLTPRGQISSYVFGATYTPTVFEKNLTLAMKNEVGEKVREEFFGCIHVDPITGERSLVIRNVLKVLGFATVAIMALSFMVLTGRTQLRKRRV